MKKVTIVNSDGSKVDGSINLDDNPIVFATANKFDIGKDGKEAFEDRVVLQFATCSITVVGKLKDFDLEEEPKAKK